MRRRAILALLAVSATARAQTTWDLTALMAELRAVRSAAGSFVEQRSIGLLTAPLRSSGTLAYTAPDRLLKQTLSPTPSRFLLEGDRLTVETQGETTQVIWLQQHPEIAGLVDSIRATLAGDLLRLTEVHEVTLAGTRAAWTLRLVPRDRRLRTMVAELRISGSGADVLGVETRSEDGDSSLMTITPGR
jgi:outer membrane lipoprotein-sorting protein